MEVHHHPKVEKKGLKEYFLEFLMIFLAVTLGFFAESLQERIVNKEKETHYIKSMLQDIKIDKEELPAVLSWQNIILNKIDSALGIPVARLTDIDVQDTFYHHFVYIYSWVSTFTHNDNAYTQLRNAGGFSVIHRQEIIDSIGLFYSFYETAVKFNGNYYTEYYNKMVQFAAQVMDLPVIPLTTDDSLLKMIPHHVEVFTRYDMTLLRELYSIIRYVKGCLLFYMKQEKTYGEMAERMIDYLAKKYDIKNE